MEEKFREKEEIKIMKNNIDIFICIDINSYYIIYGYYLVLFSSKRNNL